MVHGQWQPTHLHIAPATMRLVNALRLVLLLSLLSQVVLSFHASAPLLLPKKRMSPTTTSTLDLALSQHAGEAASLFNNMKLPASIIAGALVPLGLLSPLPIQNPDGSKESKVKKTLRYCNTPGMLSSSKQLSSKFLSPKNVRINRFYRRMLYTVTAVLSLISELLSVMWSTVAVNKLIETKILPSASVWYVLLLQDPFEGCARSR